MSDHDTADRALLERTGRGLLDVMLAKDEDEPLDPVLEDIKALRAALARRIAEGARLRKVVKALADRACDCAPFGRHECLVCQARTALVAEEPPR